MNIKNIFFITTALLSTSAYAAVPTNTSPANTIAAYAMGLPKMDQAKTEAAFEGLEICAQAMISKNDYNLKKIGDLLLNIKMMITLLQYVISIDPVGSFTAYNKYMPEFMGQFPTELQKEINTLQNNPQLTFNLAQLINDLKSLATKKPQLLLNTMQANNNNPEVQLLVSSLENSLSKPLIDIQEKINTGKWTEVMSFAHVFFKAIDTTLESIDKTVEPADRVHTKNLQRLFESLNAITTTITKNYVSKEGLTLLNELDNTFTPQIKPTIVRTMRQRAIELPALQTELNALAKEFEEKTTLLPYEVVLELNKNGLRTSAPTPPVLSPTSAR